MFSKIFNEWIPKCWEVSLHRAQMIALFKQFFFVVLQKSEFCSDCHVHSYVLLISRKDVTIFMQLVSEIMGVFTIGIHFLSEISRMQRISP